MPPPRPPRPAPCGGTSSACRPRWSARRPASAAPRACGTGPRCGPARPAAAAGPRSCRARPPASAAGPAPTTPPPAGSPHRTVGPPARPGCRRRTARRSGPGTPARPAAAAAARTGTGNPAPARSTPCCRRPIAGRTPPGACPSDGRSRTDGTSCPAHTPAALTTVRARISTSRRAVADLRGRCRSAPTTGAASGSSRRAPAAVRASATTSRASSTSCPSNDSSPPRRSAARSPGASASASGADTRRGAGSSADGVRAARRSTSPARSPVRMNAGAAAGNLGVQRDQLRQRARQVRRRRRHQDAALHRALVRQPHVALRQVTQAAVHELARPPRRAEREVPRLQQRHRQPARGRVERDAGAGHAAADHQHVDDLAVRQCGQLRRAAGGVAAATFMPAAARRPASGPARSAGRRARGRRWTAGSRTTYGCSSRKIVRAWTAGSADADRAVGLPGGELRAQVRPRSSAGSCRRAR